MSSSERGLSASRWATPVKRRDIETASPSPQSPVKRDIPLHDWHCAACNHLNFQKLAACYQCSHIFSNGEASSDNIPVQDDEEACSSKETRMSRSQSEAESQLPAEVLADFRAGKRGLSSSRWASGSTPASPASPVVLSASKRVGCTDAADELVLTSLVTSAFAKTRSGQSPASVLQ